VRRKVGGDHLIFKLGASEHTASVKELHDLG
jgi:hypothetical protein